MKLIKSECQDFKEANLPSVISALFHSTCSIKGICYKWYFSNGNFQQHNHPMFHFSPKLYLEIINWRYCPVCCPPLVPLPQSVSGLGAEQLGSLFLLEVLDQWKCSISTCQVIAPCEGQQGKNLSEWSQSQVQAVFFEIYVHTHTQRQPATHIDMKVARIFTHKRKTLPGLHNTGGCVLSCSETCKGCTCSILHSTALGPLLLKKNHFLKWLIIE